MRCNSQPKLSVVIAASHDVLLLEKCLKSLEGQIGDDTEVIVVGNYREASGERLKRSYSDVTFIFLDDDKSIPKLRTEGIKRSRGEIVAVIEDNVTLSREWCAELKKAHALPFGIIGGSVEQGDCQSALDWAVYFYEYGKYMLPNQPGRINSLPGNNISYKGELLRSVQELYSDGFFETFVNMRLVKSGESLYFAPSLIAYHSKTYRLPRIMGQCFHHGRCFGGKRANGTGAFKRLVFILGAFMLPVLLPSRVALRTFRKSRHIKKLVFCFPYVVLLLTIWSGGELFGYVFGEGDSASKWT